MVESLVVGMNWLEMHWLEINGLEMNGLERRLGDQVLRRSGLIPQRPGGTERMAAPALPAAAASRIAPRSHTV